MYGPRSLYRRSVAGSLPSSLRLEAVTSHAPILEPELILLQVRRPPKHLCYIAVIRIRIRIGICRIRMYLVLAEPHPDPLVKSADLAQDPAPDPSLFS